MLQNLIVLGIGFNLKKKIHQFAPRMINSYVGLLQRSNPRVMKLKVLEIRESLGFHEYVYVRVRLRHSRVCKACT